MRIDTENAGVRFVIPQGAKSGLDTGEPTQAFILPVWIDAT
jgi:hypothetical protein